MNTKFINDNLLLLTGYIECDVLGCQNYYKFITLLESTHWGGGAHVHLWPFDYLCYLRPHHGLGLMGISLTTRLKVLFLKEYFFGEVCNVKFMMMMMFWIEGLGLPFFLEGSPLSTWPTSQLWTNCSSIFFYGSTIFVELMTCNYQMVFISKKINMIIFSLIRKQRNIIKSWNYLTTNFHSLKLKEFI